VTEVGLIDEKKRVENLVRLSLFVNVKRWIPEYQLAADEQRKRVEQ
jgi:hypothetical protein